MKTIMHFLIVAVMCANSLPAADPEIILSNRLGLHAQVGFGGHLSAFYERRLSDLFGLEGGLVGGENFLRVDLSKVHHGGPFIGGNFYFTKIAQPSQLYIAPSISVTFGRAHIRRTSIRDQHDMENDWKEFNAIGLNGSLFFAYRYLFSFGLGLEAGIGSDVISLLFPRAGNESVKTFVFPIPKIDLGISYAF